jgi:hypothetical protein
MGSEGTRDANRGAWQTASSLISAARAKSSQAIFEARRLEKQMSDSITALFQRLTQGVYVVGVASGELRNAFTTAWVMQCRSIPCCWP